jgi:Protein kinase domain
MDRSLPPCKDVFPSSPTKRPPIQRTISSPPLSPTSSSITLTFDYLQEPSSLKIITQLTPPTSPKLVRSNSDFDDSASPTRRRTSSKGSLQPQSAYSLVEDKVKRGDIPPIIECPFEVEIAKNHSGRPQIFGQGAWSKVFRATGRLKYVPPTSASINILTPPPSPVTSIPLLVAVKTPISKASHTILHNEALTFTHLTRTPDHEDFIVPFYGYLSPSSSLVLAPVPLPLSDYIQSRARINALDSSNSTYTEPILGSTSIWLNLANKLTTSLTWLHDQARVIHGDIKPGNILLSPMRSSDGFPFDPLLIDFSSSHLLNSTTTSTPNTLSALTREYTAPELLSPSVLRDSSSTATMASDVFSLAVTLIVAATGDVMVYHGNVWQRQYMATQGWNVLDFVRNGEGGMRVPGGGVVERVVEAAVTKIDKGRIEAGKWKELVMKVTREEGKVRKLVLR